MTATVNHVLDDAPDAVHVRNTGLWRGLAKDIYRRAPLDLVILGSLLLGWLTLIVWCALTLEA